MAKLSDLTPDPDNVRKHTDRNIDMISESMREYGVNRPILIDENGTVLAGNGVLEAATEVGVDRVRVVESDGTELIAIKVSHLTDEQKAQYSVADNRATELSEWDTQKLSEEIANGLDVTGWFYADELHRMVGDVSLSEDAVVQRDEAMVQMNTELERIERNASILTCPYCYHEWDISEPAEDDAE